MSAFHLITLLPFVFFVISQSSIAAARPLMPERVKAAIQPELNLELPGVQPEKFSSYSGDVVVKKQNVPCEMSSEDGEVGLMKRFGAENYRSLFLSALPKGTTVPPSGPSRRTNAVKN
ncbi:hypothetical protein L2E82_31953 [Cichorium intybus]|uniref:Uncharacterized protein n=1 Tax=Cichorium intybus TaxID=13427 RepID=A0ACB9BG90_CICIN|nr:hypothetical protein L2E82_31953 [Cichorium intybus]